MGDPELPPDLFRQRLQLFEQLRLRFDAAVLGRVDEVVVQITDPGLAVAGGNRVE